MNDGPLVKSFLPTRNGKYQILAYDSGVEELPHLALVAIGTEMNGVVDVRIHSECLTGDVFGSVRCDCGEQLETAMQHIEKHGGVLVYLRQEGRGIGLINKLKAYNLQDTGLDTIKANHALGFHSDERDFTPAIEILNSLGIKSIRLLTNNPSKLSAFDNSGIEVQSRLPLNITPRPENEFYIRTKQESMGHWSKDEE
jgi:GTP cyclohydrolase II